MSWCKLTLARDCVPSRTSPGSVIPTRRASSCATSSRRQPMSTEDKPEKPGEEKSAKWHRARAERLREHGFTKMAEEHEQIVRAMERRRQQEETK